MDTIGLIPVGDINKEVLDSLLASIQEAFGAKTILHLPIGPPDYAYNPTRRQYYATLILRRLKSKLPSAGDRVLGVVNVDLYVPDLNFVFGAADQDGEVSVISLTRLKQEFYGLPPNQRLFHERVLKEAVHELGHTYGLGHCPDPKCVMHFSNSFKDTDKKSWKFCAKCNPISAKIVRSA